MRLVLNVIWLVLAGIWLAILYVLAGVIACVLIVTIPFGVQAFEMAGYALWPFGRRSSRQRSGSDAYALQSAARPGRYPAARRAAAAERGANPGMSRWSRRPSCRFP